MDERSSPHRIPEFFDPSFDGEPEPDDTEPETVGEGSDEVLQMPGVPSPLDLLRDPEDEPLDLPAEEGAMHVIPGEV